MSPRGQLVQLFGRFALWSMMVGCDASLVRAEVFFPIGYGGPVNTTPQGFEYFKTYFDYGYRNPNTGWFDIGFPLGIRVTVADCRQFQNRPRTVRGRDSRSWEWHSSGVGRG